MDKKFKYQEFIFYIKDVQEGVLYHDELNNKLVFKCPCGCKITKTLTINNNRVDIPVWIFNKDTLTVREPILSGYPCKSHYFITNGVVEWVQ